MDKITFKKFTQEAYNQQLKIRIEEIPMGRQFEKRQEDEEQPQGVGLGSTNTTSVISSIQKALQAEHEFEEEEDQKKDPSKRRRKPQKRVGHICICGNTACGIGPMQETTSET